MHKTPFAGLTELDDNDPLLIDGGSFTQTNPSKIDRLLQVGAVSHRHDAHSALPDPLRAPSASLDPTGGSIPAQTPIYVGYTVEDGLGGETRLSPVVNGTTDLPMNAPSGAIFASGDYSAGSLMIGNYYYGITFLDGAGGETPLGPTAAFARNPGFASAQVHLSGLATELNPPLGPVAWRLWRSVNGQQFQLLASGTGDTFLDNGVQCTDCTIQPPSPAPGGNTTKQTSLLHVTLPTPAQEPVVGSGTSHGGQIRLYLSTDGLFGSPSFYNAYPLSSAGADIQIPFLSVDTGSPPDVSTCIPGASQINPDTDLLDWHWKRPVATKTALPSGVLGDVRLVEDDADLWGVLGPAAADWTQWTPLGGGGAGSGTIRKVLDAYGHVILDPAAIEVIGGSGIKAHVYASGDTAVVQLDTPFYINGDAVLVWDDRFTGTDANDLQQRYESDGYNATNGSYYVYAGGGLERISTLGTSRLITGASATGFLATDTRGRAKFHHLPGGDTNYVLDVGINRVGPAVNDQSANDYLIAYMEGSTVLGSPKLMVYDSPGPGPPTGGNLIASAVVPEFNPGDTGWLELERIGKTVTARWYTADPDLGNAPAGTATAILGDARRAHLDANPSPGFFGFSEDISNQMVVQRVQFWSMSERLRVRLGDVDRLVLDLQGTSDFLPAVKASGGVLLSSREYLEFAASGGTSLSVTDLGGGSARILLGSPSGSVGPQGPAGASGAPGATGPAGPAGTGGGGGGVQPTVAGSGGVPTLLNKPYVEYGGSGGINVGIQDLGGGSARVVLGVTAMSVKSYVAQTENVGPGGVAPTPDRVSFSTPSGAVILVAASLELGSSTTDNEVDVELYIDGHVARDAGTSLVGAGLQGVKGVFRTVFTQPMASGATTGGHSDFAVQSGISDMRLDGDVLWGGRGHPLAFFVPAGNHTVELRYQHFGGVPQARNRSLIVGVAGAFGGGGGHTIESGSAGAAVTVLPSQPNLAFGSGLIATDDPVHGTTQVKVNLTRQGMVFSSPSLASGWQASGVVGGSANLDVPTGSVKGMLIYEVATDRPARVRLYTGSGDRLADAGRNIGTDPTGDHGVMLELVTIPTDTDWRMSPMVGYANLDPPLMGSGSTLLPLRIDNLGAVGPVQVTINHLPLEF